MKTTRYIVRKGNTGYALGRVSINGPLGWVDEMFASVYDSMEDAQQAAIAAFGAADALLGEDVRVRAF